MFVLSLIIVMIPLIRHNDYSLLYLDPLAWIETSINNLFKVFVEISSVDRDMMTYDLFSERSFWYGKSYLGLLYAWIPRGFYPNKPPVDDGVYLANFINGFEVEPILPYDEIILHSSSPFSSFGIMYSNFGVIGVILGSYLLVMVYKMMYKRMILNRSLSNVLIYGYTMLVFGLSVHSILSLFVPAFLIWLTIGKKNYSIIINRRCS